LINYFEIHTDDPEQLRLHMELTLTEEAKLLYVVDEVDTSHNYQSQFYHPSYK
jgi:hypothetical protein